MTNKLYTEEQADLLRVVTLAISATEGEGSPAMDHLTAIAIIKALDDAGYLVVHGSKIDLAINPDPDLLG